MKYLTFSLILSAFMFVNPNLKGQDNTIKNAKQLIAMGNFQNALDILNLHIEQYPDDANAYIMRAVAHGNLGRVSEKAKDLEFAKFLNPYAQLYISDSYRSMFYQKKRYVYDFSGLSENFTSSPIKSKYYDQYYNDVIKMHAQDSLLAQTIFYLSKNDIENAENTMSKISDTESVQGILYDIQGIIALKKNETQEAILLFTKSIDHSPSFPLAYHNRAIAYKTLKQYDLANNDLQIALSLNEDISVFYFTLASLNEKLNDMDEAKENYKTALDLDPNYTEARTNHSLLQKTLGNYSESMLDLARIADETMNQDKADFIRGGIHLTYGEYEDSIEAFNKYIKSNPEDSDAFFNRGLALVLKGKVSDGCDDIRNSIELQTSPNRVEIKDAFCK